MNRVLLISFDLLRDGEPPKSYAVSHIVSYAKSQPNNNIDFTIEHLTLDMTSFIEKNQFEIINECLTKFNPREFDIIAISAYVWNEFIISPLIGKIKDNSFKGNIVLGGYQITYTSGAAKLKDLYPQADSFILGYAEQSFHELISSEKFKTDYHSNVSDFTHLNSPYLSKQIHIEQKQQKIRWETKRGCLYSCKFCAHKEIGELGTKTSVIQHQLEKVDNELDLFKSKSVKRINVLDPLFNVGRSYLEVLKKIIEKEMTSEFTFQIRLENIKTINGDREMFIEYSKSINCILEIGIQTLQENEWEVIGRNNNIGLIRSNLEIFNKNNINYEASLIYGLPNQTVKSFKDSISKLKDLGCKKITAWPLMLLRGTDIYHQKETLNLNEKILGDYNIPTVISSNSYTYDDWLEMQSIAIDLTTNPRF